MKKQRAGAGMWGPRGGGAAGLGGAAVIAAGLLGWAQPGWGCDTEELEKELAQDAALDRTGGGGENGGESGAGSPLSRRERVRPPDERWGDYNRYFTWYESVAAARAAALRERKLLFVVQMVGNLRDGGT